MAVASILVGKLSDIYGRKPFILAGIGLFTIGAFFSGLSGDIFQLIAFRAITGFGAGIIMSTSFTAIGDLYLPRERARWTGLMSGIFGISSVLGPLMGGYIVDHLNWQWVFWMFLPLGIVAFIMIAILFPKVPRREGETIDFIGSFFITVTIIALLLAFSLGGVGPGQYAWGSWQILGLFGLTMISLIAFIITETKVKSPVLPLKLFKNDIVTLSNIGLFLLSAGMMGVMIYAPFFIQGVKGILPSGSGYMMMPMSIVMVFGTAFAGQFMTSTGKYKLMTIIGLSTASLGIFLLSLISAGTPIYLMIIYLSLVGLGLGVSMPVFSLIVQNAVPLRDLGVASASSQLFRNLGNTIGVGILGSIMNSTMATETAEKFSEGNSIDQSQMPADQMSALMNPELLLDKPQLDKFLDSLPSEVLPLANQIVDITRGILSDALTTTFFVGAIIMLIAVIITLFIRAIPLVSAKGSSKEESEQTVTSKKEAHSHG